MDVEQQKCVTIVFGDSTQRMTIMMPATLSGLLERVQRAFNVTNVELWLDSGAQGRIPGQGREKIVTEGHYKSIVDGDVIVFLVNGKTAKKTSAFDAEFQDITTYTNDYTPKAFPEPLGGPADDDGPCLGIPHDYSTTYGRDFEPKTLAPETRLQVEYPHPATLPFQGQTTYQTDFVPKDLPPRHDVSSKPWTYHGAPPVIPKSTYSYDYTCQSNKKQLPRTMMQKQPLPRHPGAPAPDTEYQAKYKGERGAYTLHPETDDPPAWNPPPVGTSTYKRDYLPHDRHAGHRILHVEPGANDP